MDQAEMVTKAKCDVNLLTIPHGQFLSIRW